MREAAIALGIEPGDAGVRLLKMKIFAEVMSRGMLIDKDQDDAQEEGPMVLPEDPSIDRTIHLFRKHGWLESYEFTQHEAWQACRGWMEELDGEMPCGVACKAADVVGCFKQSFPIHLLRSDQPFKAPHVTDAEREEWEYTVEHGYLPDA